MQALSDDAASLAALKLSFAAIQSSGAKVEAVVKGATVVEATKKDAAHNLKSVSQAMPIVQNELAELTALNAKTTVRIRKTQRMVEALNEVRLRAHQDMADELLEKFLADGTFTLQELEEVFTMPENRMDPGVLVLVERGVRIFGAIEDLIKSAGVSNADPEILYAKLVEAVALRNAERMDDVETDVAALEALSELAVHELKHHIMELKSWSEEYHLWALHNVAKEVLTPSKRKEFADAAFVLRVCLAHVPNGDEVLAQKLFEKVTSPAPQTSVEGHVDEEEELVAEEGEGEEEKVSDAHASLTSGHVSATNACASAAESSAQVAESTEAYAAAV